MVMNTIELMHHWKKHTRSAKAGSLIGARKYKKMFGETANIVGYFEGKAQAQTEAINIIEYMIEYQEMFYGDG
jgi:hypothetical protein